VSEPPFFVSSAAVASVFAWPDAIDALTRAYRAGVGPEAAPPRTVAKDDGAWLRTLSAVPAGGRYFGTKLMARAPSTRGSVIQYVIVLWDRETSRIAALVDGHEVTAYRTAATSAAALDRLAPPGPLELAVLGSGLEASMHVRAFAAVRPIRRLLVSSPTLEHREAFAAAATADLGCEAASVNDARAAVERAPVVLAAARSRGERPILYGEWLRPDATIVSIGSTVPQQREIDVSVVEACDIIVCDTVTEVTEHTGDMLRATQAGIEFRHKTFSLHDLLAERLSRPLGSARRRMFKSVGEGLQDVVVAEVILRKALEAGLAATLPVEFDAKDPKD
jgi:ornithine cyclodeaminase/alanine dehydrogenase-like protein (mu-crystallin family)